MRKLFVVALSGMLLAMAGSPAWAAPASKPDLVVTKQDSADPVASGSSFNYAVTVANIGKAAKAVVLLDTLPDEVSLQAIESPSATCTFLAATHRVRCDRGELASGAAFTVTLTVVPQVDHSQTIWNSATASSSKPDGNAANNTDTESTLVTGPKADLAVVKTDAPDPVPVEGVLTYTITVRNNGPDSAVKAVAVDDLPAGVTFTEASSTAGSCAEAAGIVRCQLGTLSNDALVTITIKGTPHNAGTIKNQVAVSSDTEDPQPANNSDTETTEVTPPGPAADLHTSVVGPATATVGDSTLQYVVELTSSGPQPAGEVTFTVSLTPGLSLQFTDDAGTNATGSCTPANAQLINCTVTNFGPTNNVHLALTVSATAAGSQSVSVQAVSDTADPNEADNSDTTTTVVT